MDRLNVSRRTWITESERRKVLNLNRNDREFIRAAQRCITVLEREVEAKLPIVDCVDQDILSDFEVLKHDIVTSIDRFSKSLMIHLGVRERLIEMENPSESFTESSPEDSPKDSCLSNQTREEKANGNTGEKSNDNGENETQSAPAQKDNGNGE